jgi:hypothetical protein
VAGRGDALRQRREARFDEWFKDRRWRVCAEMNGEREANGSTVHYRGGFFRIDPPAVFQTPLGHKGRSGYLVQEVDKEGRDIPDSRHPFGRRTLEHAVSAYQSVTGLPAKDPHIP